MHTLPHGGLEVGGLLFGRVFPNGRTPHRVEVVAERSIECAHASGPAFILSEEERAQIAAQLEQARRDVELSGLSVLGFWVSHSRGELALSLDDVELYKLFPNSWQIILLLKPKLGEATRANFAFRSGGQVHGPNPVTDFSVDSSGGPIPMPVPMPVPALEDEVNLPKTTAIRSVSLGTAIALMLLALAAGGSLGYKLPRAGDGVRPVSAESPLGVQVFNAGPGTAVHWNAHARELRGASGAHLVVVDTMKTYEYPLTAADMEKGYYYCDSIHNARMAAIRVDGPVK